MIKLQIEKKDGYIYNLKDKNEKIYILNLEFLDIEEVPREGDFIEISAELLNPKYAGYSTSYTFGDLDNKYGKENIKMNDLDVVKLEIHGKEIYLKRLYG